MVENIYINIGADSIASCFHPSQDGSTGSKKCIITCHGMLSDMNSQKAVDLAEKAAVQGLNVLRFDFRGCGSSSGELKDSLSSRRYRDLERVIEFARDDLGMEEIGLFGSSLGGFVSLLKASCGEISSLVSVSSPFTMAELLESIRDSSGRIIIDEYHISNEFVTDAVVYDQKLCSNLNRIECPVLLVHGGADPLVPVDHARVINEQLGSNSKLVIIDGADHSYSRWEHRSRLIDLSLDWFMTYL